MRNSQGRFNALYMYCKQELTYKTLIIHVDPIKYFYVLFVHYYHMYMFYMILVILYHAIIFPLLNIVYYHNMYFACTRASVRSTCTCICS